MMWYLYVVNEERKRERETIMDAVSTQDRLCNKMQQMQCSAVQCGTPDPSHGDKQ